MMKIGIVGSGKMGVLHGAILGALPEAEVVAVCEKKRVVRRLARGALPEVSVVEEVGELAAFDLDAVYVATLPGSHHPVLAEIYGRGVADNVFVEKPLAASHDEALEICRLAEARGGVTMVGFQKRFNRLFDKARQLLAEGAVGEVSGFDAWAYSSDFLAEAAADSPQSVSRGGVFRDQGSHAIDLARWYFGDLEVMEDGEEPPEGSPPDFSYGRVRTSAGAVGTFSVSGQMAEYRLPEIGMTITGSAAKIEVNDDRLALLDDGKPRTWHKQDVADNEVPFVLGESDYTRESEAFLAAIEDGRPHEGADFAAGAEVERIIDGFLGVGHD